MAINIASILIAIVLIFIVTYLVRRFFDNRNYTYPPGPKSLPIVGNLFNINLKQLHKVLWDHREKYGDVSSFKLAGTNFVVLNSMDSISEALKGDEFKIIFSGRHKTFFADYIAPNDMTLHSHSEKWVKLQNLMHMALKPSHGGRGIETIIKNELSLLLDDLERTNGELFDIHPYITKSVVNGVYIMIRGQRFEYDHEIHDLQHKADKETLRLFNHDPILTLLPFLRHIPIGSGRVYQNVRFLLDSIMKYLYHDVREEASYENKNGFVYDMLRKQQEVDWLTDENIYDLVMDILFAGVISTAVTLYSLILFLTYRQDIQKRLQEEIDATVGTENELSLDDQINMPYTQAVILETLRITAITPFLAPHTVMSDVTFRGYRLKKDTVILANSWRVHHDTEHWDEPWDFKPELFLDDAGQVLPPDHPTRKNMLVFGMGKRRCIGDAFAKTRMFLFVTHLYQRFNVFNEKMEDMSSMDPREFVYEFLVKPNDYKIQLTVRK